MPKFELNPIEYFWGTVKKYLHDNCDYSFDGLKEDLLNLSIGFGSHTRMDAYGEGLGSVEAQLRVKKFSSRKYKSHRRILENVARLLD